MTSDNNPTAAADVERLLQKLASAANDMLIGVGIHNRLDPDAGARREDIQGPVVSALQKTYAEARNYLATPTTPVRDEPLWCMHVRGPDDVVAVESYQEAVNYSDHLNRFLAKQPKLEYDPHISAIPALWDGPAETHAKDLERRKQKGHDYPWPSPPANDEPVILGAPPVLDEWQPIETAPKDGRFVVLWMVHANAAYSKDPVEEGWACPVIAKWIDDNGGGWTWHGLCGVPKAWAALPLPTPTSEPA